MDKGKKDKHKGTTVADIYQVQPGYARFDQKNDITRQHFWNPPAMALFQQKNENLRKRVSQGLPGYGLRDWAFYMAASANIKATGFSINSPNRRGNSWQPLAEPDNIPPLLKTAEKPVADPVKATAMVSKMARRFGADQSGIARLDRRWVYSHWFDEDTREHYPIRFSDEPGYEQYQSPVQLPDKTQVIPASMKYVIVLLYEMDESGMATAPTLTQQATTHTTYARISATTVALAEFIRGLGYNAIPSANDTAISIPLAIDAGLGELGRNAKLINPRFGPRCRISKVITDLPLVPGRPRLWGVTEFCDACGKCARECPAQAIPTGKRSFEPIAISNNGGVLIWQLDHMKCYDYWARVGTNCGICIRTCPFNKSAHWSHDIVRAIVRLKSRRIDAVITRMDDILGYGRYKKPENFWKA